MRSEITQNKEWTAFHIHCSVSSIQKWRRRRKLSLHQEDARSSGGKGAAPALSVSQNVHVRHCLVAQDYSVLVHCNKTDSCVDETCALWRSSPPPRMTISCWRQRLLYPKTERKNPAAAHGGEEGRQNAAAGDGNAREGGKSGWGSSSLVRQRL